MKKSSAEIIGLYEKYVMPTYSQSLALVKGSGAQVWDADGREYLDFAAGIAVTSVGHAHPRLVRVLSEQVGRLQHVSNIYYNEWQPQLAQALVEKSGLGGKCFFCNSGAEANEGLIKLARLWGHEAGRYEVISMRDSFHGRTLATLTATGQDKVQKGFEPLPDGFRYAEFNNLASCEKAITPKTAAIIVEAIQGEGGILPAKPEFMTGLRKLCDERGILLFCDEVQCGMGRTGQWFGYQNYDIKPDAISLAKGLGGGFPIGAIVSGSKLANVFQPGKHGTTFGGNPLACAVALEVHRIIEDEDLLANAAKMGARLQGHLRRLNHPSIKEVRGLGLMVGVVLARPVKELLPILQDQGLLALAAGEKVLRLVPPLNIQEQEIDRGAEILAAVFAG